MALTGILVFFLFTRCEKDTSVDLQINQKLIDEVKQLSSESDQRLAYNLLTSGEKALLWTQKLTTILKSDLLNEQQRSHIEKLNSFINSTRFEKSDDGTLLVDSFAKSWCMEGLNYFTKDEIKSIAFSINTIDPNDIKFKNGIITPNLTELPDCNCNSTSAFSCNSCSAPAKCKETSMGCGFLMLYECDGRCTAPMK